MSRQYTDSKKKRSHMTVSFPNRAHKLMAYLSETMVIKNIKQ